MDRALWLTVNIGAATAVLGIIGALITSWMNGVIDDDQMDTAMRRAGHVPPESDPERTDWIPAIPTRLASPGGFYGLLRREDEQRAGRHRPGVGGLSVPDLLARELVPA